jgi:hypothetical protein
MTTLELTKTLDDERLSPFLPLISEVWEDGTLTDLEIAAVCMALIRHPHTDLSCNSALQGWLDPAHPPTVRDLEALRERIEQGAVRA